MSVSGCYQGVLGFKAAETRLRERDKDFTYLTGESDVKKGKYILSFQSYQEASSVMVKMILSNDECVHPVPVPPRNCDTSDENNNSMDYECAYVLVTMLVMPVTLLLDTPES